MTTVKLVRVGRPDVPLPRYASDGAAGLDLHAAILGPAVLQPGGRLDVPTGFAVEVQPGFEAQIRPRSGLALRHGVTVANAPGTIDSDYRGEVRVILINLGQEPYSIQPLDRIAQMVIARVERAEIEPVEALASSTRGSGGFGSTGT